MILLCAKRLQFDKRHEQNIFVVELDYSFLMSTTYKLPVGGNISSHKIPVVCFWPKGVEEIDGTSIYLCSQFLSPIAISGSH